MNKFRRSLSEVGNRDGGSQRRGISHFGEFLLFYVMPSPWWLAFLMLALSGHQALADTVTVSPTAPSVAADAGSVEITLTYSRGVNEQQSGELFVTWETNDGTATASVDYIGVSGGGLFDRVEGPLTQTEVISIPIVNNPDLTAPRTFTLNLTCDESFSESPCPSDVFPTSTVTITITPVSTTQPPTPTPLGELPGLTENERSVASALIGACDGATGELAQRCSDLLGSELSDAEKIAALSQITPEQVASQTSTPLRIGTGRMANLRQRLTQLRHGGGGLDLAMNIDGRNISYAQLARALGKESGGAAGDSPDDPLRDGPLGFFVQGRFNGGDRDGTREERGYRFTSGGVTVGADYRLTDQLVLGLAFGYDGTSSVFSQDSGAMDTDSYHGSFYGSYYLPQDFYVDWIGNFTRHDYDMKRNIRYSGFSSRARSNPEGNQYGFAVSVGKDFAISEWSLNPYLRMEYAKLQIDAYQERGGGGLGLAFSSQDDHSLTTDLGAQIGRSFSLPWGVLTPSIRFEWEHQYQNGSRDIRGRFVDAAPGTGGFTISNSVPDRDYFNLGGSLAATLPGGNAAFLRYETRLGQRTVSSHIVEAGVRISF
ncbi:autotransporter domain-containing protein [Methylocaldum szegediense]|uniref:Outer membrane autotransporter protein n=1 Tax=Methylocaldum szegediense TaxID=73780 RepID=A0ABN8X3M8_9GAMM|nr:autotransporter domain-containing protein [Methylocaldum szegediense]CAI8855812.1 Outer membrane autotransporter protein [Methylocaldum szegediense]